MLVDQAEVLSRLKIAGGSMLPAIHPGEEIEVRWAEPTRARSVRPGDIVLYPDAADPGAWILHRVVGVERGSGAERLIVKGDASCRFELLDPSQPWATLVGSRTIFDLGIARISRPWIFRYRAFRIPARALISMLGSLSRLNRRANTWRGNKILALTDSQWQWIRECLRPTSSRDELPAPTLPLDSRFWQQSLELLERAGATGPALLRMSRARWYSADHVSVPPELRRLLDARLSQERMRLMLLDEISHRAQASLKLARIGATAFKGAEFAHRLYPERMLRPMSDVDLLISRESRDRAVATLQASGFRLVNPLVPGRDQVELEDEAIPGMSVELHWGAIQVGSRIEELIYAIRHTAVQHRLDSVFWLWDIHYLLQKLEPSERQSLPSRVRESRISAAAYLLFTLIDREWATPHAGKLAAAIAPSLSRRRRKRLEALASTEAWYGVGGLSLTPFEILRRRSLMLDRATDVIAFWARSIRRVSANRAP